MPQLKWNDFVAQYKDNAAFLAGTLAFRIPGRFMDQERRIVPSPYTMVTTLLRKQLVHDWATTVFKIPIAIVGVSHEDDLKMVARLFNAGKAPVDLDPFGKVYPLRFKPEHIQGVAKSVGYTPPFIQARVPKRKTPKRKR